MGLGDKLENVGELTCVWERKVSMWMSERKQKEKEGAEGNQLNRGLYLEGEEGWSKNEAVGREDLNG